MGRSVGIDLGTTFSAIAAVDESGHPFIIANSEGNKVTPSVIYFNGEEPVVGEVAKEMQALGESNIASFFKRSMGDNRFVLSFNHKEYNPTDLSSILLKKIKSDAEAVLGEEITHAVITVPAYFNNFQREATIKAGEIAGLNVLRIINEPTSAALAYGLDKSAPDQTVLVYDLGGGTFDVSIVQISAKCTEVLATGGDHQLGGKDWDDRIAAYLGQQFFQEHGVDPLEYSESFQDILTRTEYAKKQLSQRESVRISIVHAGEKEDYQLSRSQLEEMTEDLMERTRSLCRKVLEDSNLKWSELSGVLLVGGSTRMPMVREYVASMSGKAPLTRVNADEAVALGAAIQAHIDSTEIKRLTPDSRHTLPGLKIIKDVMSHSLGMVAINPDRSRYINSIIIPKNTPVPCLKTRPYQLRTSKNSENTLEVYMLQGESQYPLDCHILGKYVFSGIRHTTDEPVTTLNIEYRYDRNGVVTVSAFQENPKSDDRLLLSVEPVPADLSWLGEPPPPEEEILLNEMTVFLVIDVSNSMEGSPLREAITAARAFVNECNLEHMSVGVAQFGRQAKIIIPPSRKAKKINSAIDRLKINGSTNMTAGIRLTHLKLKKVDSLRYIILLTDGEPNNKMRTEKVAKAAREDGIEIISIGTGQADKGFLKRISSSDTNCLFAQSGTVAETFSKIAQQLTQSGMKR